MRTRNVGRFRVDKLFFDGLKPCEGINLFHDMVVLRAEEDMCSFATIYVAIHPQFRPIAPGELVPEYEAIFTKDTAYPTWKEIDRAG